MMTTHTEESRALMSKAHRARQTRPPWQGGNGRPMPFPQEALAIALGWQTELVVSTRLGGGYPRCYRLDIYDPEHRIAVEVDGGSHGTVRVQRRDARKDARLAALGWRVVRVTNRDVRRSLAAVLDRIEEAINH